MPYYMYVALQEDDTIAVLTIDPHTGRLTPQGEAAIPGTGPHAIWQFTFDAHPGRLTPTAPARVEPDALLGPRHFCFHPSLDILYFSNEQGCSVTGYRLDPATGTLTALQTLTTLPEGYTERNTCSQIQITASGRFLYA